MYLTDYIISLEMKRLLSLNPCNNRIVRIPILGKTYKAVVIAENVTPQKWFKVIYSELLEEENLTNDALISVMNDYIRIDFDIL